MRTNQHRWIVLGLVAVVGLGLGLWTFLLGPGVGRGAAGEDGAGRTTVPATPGSTDVGPVRSELVAPALVVPGRDGGGGDTYTTVLWPLEVELELVEARHRPKADGVPAAGTGADAILRGQITGDEGLPVQGVRVEFLEGANAGRVLVATQGGEFGANDLYPGLSIVAVRGEKILGARREVRLRSRKETLLNVPFGRPAAVFGQVFDHAGEPLADAEVLFDGVRIHTDTEGGFYLARVAGGPCLVEVRAEGHAALREVVNVASGRVLERDRCKFRLQRACTLELTTSDRVGGPGPIEVTLLPVDDRATRTFPWYSVNPVLVEPGVPTRVEGLPRGSARVLGFRRGALLEERVASLRHDRPSSVELSLRPAPKLRGTVTRDGEPVAGALVRMEAPDRVQATLAFHRKPSYFLETAVMEFPAPALQEATTDAAGAFQLTAWDDVSPVRYLEAWGPANATWAGRVVRRGTEEVAIELEDVSFGRSVLELDLLGRHMGLPVSVTVNGQPHQELVLPADAPLEVHSLVEGVWRLRASWQAKVVQEEVLLELDGEEARNLPLLPEMIDGQSAEEWSRAGREWPGPRR